MSVPLASDLKLYQQLRPPRLQKASGLQLKQTIKSPSVFAGRQSRGVKVTQSSQAMPDPAAAAPAAEESKVLNQEELKRFEKDGYIVLENFASPGECAALIERANSLVDGFNPEKISVFSTTNQASNSDDYFFESANNISFFFEEGAHDEQGNLRQEKALSINKIGHAIHDLDPVFRKFTRSSKMTELLLELGLVKPLPVQSMYIFKQPRIGGKYAPHQDGSFLATEPHSVIGLWLAVEDATLENGCLWTLPGSHRDGVQNRMLGINKKVSFDKAMPEYDLSKFTPLEVKAGTLIALHHANVHFSEHNTSSKSRHAYSLHVVDGSDQHIWQPDNWLQRRPDLPLEPMLPGKGLTPMVQV
ncbi:hypothetical protein WJX74_009176 [Apatococcus lobatus]|uniref:Phytanoyl-CoA dioxygenase n=2 Tax=Apatococcus TaxID=904362 RepID=A0AAW1SUV4_9CHLO